MIQSKIVEYLDEIIPNPKCELIYTKDYELLIAVMLSAQTTDKKVNEVTNILFSKYPTLEDISKSDINDLINIIRPLGNFTKKAYSIKQIATSLLPLKKVPNDRQFLENLSGVGRKTTNVVLSTLFNENFIAVDTHVSRVSKRLNIAKEKDDVYTIEKKLNKFFKNYNLGRLHHQLVLFGRYYCKSKNPLCENCKLNNICKIKSSQK